MESSRSTPPALVVQDHRFLLIWEDGSTDPNRVVAALAAFRCRWADAP